MSTFLLISSVALWLAVLLLGFLLLGALRALGILKWQLEQLQATTPSRLGRDGLRVGKKAPAFRLPSVNPHVVARSPDRATLASPGNDAADLRRPGPFLFFLGRKTKICAAEKPVSRQLYR